MTRSFEPGDLVASHEVVREVGEIDRDPRREQWILRLRVERRQLGPGDVERLDVREAARTEDPALEGLPSHRQRRQEALGLGARERRHGLLADGRHT
jgi:hypothetical protein